MSMLVIYKTGSTFELHQVNPDGTTVIITLPETFRQVCDFELSGRPGQRITKEMIDHCVMLESLRIREIITSAADKANAIMEQAEAAEAKALLEAEQAQKQFQLQISKPTEPNQLELFTTPEVTAIATPAAEILNNGTTTPTATTA